MREIRQLWKEGTKTLFPVGRETGTICADLGVSSRSLTDVNSTEEQYRGPMKGYPPEPLIHLTTALSKDGVRGKGILPIPWLGIQYK